MAKPILVIGGGVGLMANTVKALKANEHKVVVASPLPEHGNTTFSIETSISRKNKGSPASLRLTPRYHL